MAEEPDSPAWRGMLVSYSREKLYGGSCMLCCLQYCAKRLHMACVLNLSMFFAGRNCIFGDLFQQICSINAMCLQRQTLCFLYRSAQQIASVAIRPESTFGYANIVGQVGCAMTSLNSRPDTVRLNALIKYYSVLRMSKNCTQSMLTMSKRMPP